MLSPDQEKAVEAFESGKNIFLTGPGGTGKSFLIRRFSVLKPKVQVCAMTGTAAMLLECNASTLHSWAGIGTGAGDLVAKVSGSFTSSKKWRRTNVLILDEVSMLNQELFEKLDAVAKSVRRSSRPFGGLQVVFCGDFCQLPPVSTDNVPSRYCFESPLWEITFEHQIMLTTIHRQKDVAFCNILQQIRTGKIKRSTYDMLMSRVLSEDRPLAFPATRIVPTRDKADKINRTEYEKLESSETSFHAKIIRYYESTPAKLKERSHIPQQVVDNECDYLLNRRVNSPVIHLKIGAHVMCTHNVDTSLCNGSQGVVKQIVGGLPVVAFMPDGKERTIFPVTIESERVPALAVTHIPLMYAWAITIHKAQGATLDAAVIDVGSGIFEKGQTYTALSRLSSFEHLYLTSFDPSKIKTDPVVHDFYAKMSSMPL
jgi:ATP-dependent DNA helicase PIF1